MVHEFYQRKKLCNSLYIRKLDIYYIYLETGDIYEYINVLDLNMHGIVRSKDSKISYLKWHIWDQ